MKTNRERISNEGLKKIMFCSVLVIIFILVFAYSFCSYGGWMSKKDLSEATNDLLNEVKYLESVKGYLKTEDGTYYEVQKIENYKGLKTQIKMDSEGKISYEIVDLFSYLHIQIIISLSLALIVILFTSSIIEDIVEDFFYRKEEKNKKKKD